MEDEAHVRLVDPHAEGDGGTDDHALVGHEQALCLGPVLGPHAGMIGDGAEPLGDEEGSPLLGRLARQGIDDAGLARPAIEKINELLLGIVLGRHGKLQVGPVKARDIDLRLATEDLAHNVAPGRLVRRRGKGADGNTGEGPPERLQHVIFRTERRAPLRNAVGLVNGDQLHVKAGQGAHHALRHQPFGREIEQAHLAARHAPPDGDVVLPVLGGVDALGGDASQFQRRHLVLHQRHQRRNDDGEASPRQCGHLIAQRLARPRGHDGQHVAALKERGDDALLAGPEALVTEGFSEDVVRFHAGTCSGSTAIRGMLIVFVVPKPNWIPPAIVHTPKRPPSLRTFPF